MNQIPASTLVVPARGPGEDRISLRHSDDVTVAVVADGAGGLSGGGKAAEIVNSAVGEPGTLSQDQSTASLEHLLEEIDRRILHARDAGESTAVIALVTPSQVVGVSVGDSEAWLIDGSEPQVLTRNQIRKPLLGSGAARAQGFGPVPRRGRLVLGTDGLFKYCARSVMLDIVANLPIDKLAASLVEAVRLPSGALQDDVAVIAIDLSEPVNQRLHLTGSAGR